MSHRRPPAPTLRPQAPAARRRPVALRSPLSAFGASPCRLRPALTLIEMLVALAVTLVMMAAVVNLFANLSGSIRNRRAMIEAGAQLRQVRTRMALDLAGATVKGHTWVRPDENEGYLEYIEGEFNDVEPSRLVDGVPNNGEIDYATSLVPSGGDPLMNLSVTVPPRTAPLSTRPPVEDDVTNGRGLGDWDDILALTVRSESDPFTAQIGGATVESPLAEVVWFAGENDPGDPGEPGFRRVYRKVFLIAPWLGPWNFNDKPGNISVRFDPPANPGELGRWVANTLGELTKRENRAYRDATSTDPNRPFVFPYFLYRQNLNSDQEYLMLSDALAFDVRIYDPGAPLYVMNTGDVVQPGDPVWPARALQARAAFQASPTDPVGIPSSYGAYCDLGWNWNRYARTPYVTGNWMPIGPSQPQFEVPHQPGWHRHLINKQSLVDYSAVYDTWSFHYENDNLDQDQLLVAWWESQDTPSTPRVEFPPWRVGVYDQGANGLDDDNAYGVDDPGERETSPPYDVPLNGLQVRFRIYERDARQIREVSVTQSYAP